MKNRTTVILIISGVLLILFIVLAVRMNKHRVSWYETYDIESKEPYGTFVMGELLKNYSPGKNFFVINKRLEEALREDNSGEKKNYFFIGNRTDFDSIQAKALIQFVAHGNSAFISASTYSTWFLSHLFPDTCLSFEDNYYSVEDYIAEMKFYSDGAHPKSNYKLSYVFANEPYKYSWTYFDSSYFCGRNDTARSLGYINRGFINFVKLHYGFGDFYLHSTPIAFTNYSLLKNENLEYAERIFSFLPSQNILWDELNKSPGDLDFNKDLKLSQSPLEYILGQESLRWSWYIILLLLLLYILFFGKRKQRIIPVIEPNANTSLEFVNTIGQLYYRERNHKVLCVHKMKLFLAFIRNRYFINTNNIDDNVIEKISVKSQVPKEQIKNIFSSYTWIDRNINITSDQLIEFHLLIENFYKNCK